MAANVIDGKALAAKCKARVAQEVRSFSRRPGLGRWVFLLAGLLLALFAILALHRVLQLRSTSGKLVALGAFWPLALQAALFVLYNLGWSPLPPAVPSLSLLRHRLYGRQPSAGRGSDVGPPHGCPGAGRYARRPEPPLSAGGLHSPPPRRRAAYLLEKAGTGELTAGPRLSACQKLF